MSVRQDYLKAVDKQIELHKNNTDKLKSISVDLMDLQKRWHDDVTFCMLLGLKLQYVQSFLNKLEA